MWLDHMLQNVENERSHTDIWPCRISHRRSTHTVVWLAICSIFNRAYDMQRSQISVSARLVKIYIFRTICVYSQFDLNNHHSFTLHKCKFACVIHFLYRVNKARISRMNIWRLNSNRKQQPQQHQYQHQQLQPKNDGDKKTAREKKQKRRID